MLKRRIIFSLVFIFFGLYAIFIHGKSNYLVILGFIPFLFYITNLFKIRIPISFEIVLLFFLLLSTGFGSLLGYYELFKWYDLFLHMCAGAISAIVSIFYINKYKLKLKKITKYTLVLLVSMGVSALWEMYEYSVDLFLGYNMQRVEQGIIDTMNDICIHALGSIVIILLFYFDDSLFKNKVSNFFEYLNVYDK